mgnify:CR=1 FL=1
MKQIFLFKYYNLLLQNTYNRTLKHNGFTPCGVCWNSQKSQYIRFNILTFLVKRFSLNNHLKIADVGCGYAELLNYFLKENKNYVYEGYDINKNMIDFCRNKFKNFNFYTESFPVNNCDISIMSGTYNYAVTNSINSWEDYLIHNLSQCITRCNLGMIFNLQFEKKRSIRNNIYYTNITFMYDLLTKNFRRVEKFFSNKSSKDIYFLIYKN